MRKKVVSVKVWIGSRGTSLECAGPPGRNEFEGASCGACVHCRAQRCRVFFVLWLITAALMESEDTFSEDIPKFHNGFHFQAFSNAPDTSAGASSDQAQILFVVWPFPLLAISKCCGFLHHRLFLACPSIFGGSLLHRDKLHAFSLFCWVAGFHCFPDCYIAIVLHATIVGQSGPITLFLVGVSFLVFVLPVCLFCSSIWWWKDVVCVAADLQDLPLIQSTITEWSILSFCQFWCVFHCVAFGILRLCMRWICPLCLRSCHHLHSAYCCLVLFRHCLVR